MAEPFLATLLLLMSVLVLVNVAVRQRRTSPGDDVDLDQIPVAAALITGITLSVVGASLVTQSTLLGLVLVGLAALSFVSFARMALARRRRLSRPLSAGELTRPAEDYIIWTAIGLPLLMGLMLIVFVTSGSFGAH